MRKLVNGKVVDIDNIELFRLGAEGLALSKTAISRTSDGIEPKINSPLLSKILEYYNLFLQIMPYPLYSIEEDIKYATMANFIANKVEEELKKWVKNGLFIVLDTESDMCLHIVNNTWGIVNIGKSNWLPDNSDLERFSGNVGYKEYSWLLESIDNIINKKGRYNFYEVFMPKFLEACNYQSMVIKWELKNILEFGPIPERKEYESNKVINVDNGDEYLLDIYQTGTAESSVDNGKQSWNLDTGSSNGARNRHIKLYGYDLYKKSDRGTSTGKLEKSELVGIKNIFLALTSLKNLSDIQEMPEFKAIITGNSLVYKIDNTLYFCKSNRLNEPTKIAKGVDLIGCDRGQIYLSKKRRINDRVTEEYVYSYNLRDNGLRLCRIGYE